MEYCSAFNSWGKHAVTNHRTRHGARTTWRCVQWQRSDVLRDCVFAKLGMFAFALQSLYYRKFSCRSVALRGNLDSQVLKMIRNDSLNIHGYWTYFFIWLWLTLKFNILTSTHVSSFSLYFFSTIVDDKTEIHAIQQSA